MYAKWSENFDYELGCLLSDLQHMQRPHLLVGHEPGVESFSGRQSCFSNSQSQFLEAAVDLQKVDI